MNLSWCCNLIKRFSMAEIFDLCIIGSGIFGSAVIKYALAYSDMKVCLIGPEEPTMDEWKQRTILGSHYDEGRIVAVGDSCGYFTSFSKETISVFKSSDNAYTTGLFNQTGVLYLYDSYNSCVSNKLEECNTGNTKWLNLSDRDIFSQRFPYLLMGSNEFALFYTDGGHISPRKLVERQKKVALKNGCRIINDCVTDVKITSTGMHQVVTEKNTVVLSKKILICTGAFTNFLPLFAEKKLAIKINKETYVLLRICEKEANRLRNMPPIILRSVKIPTQPQLHGAYILPPIQYPDGHFYLKIGHKGNIINSELETLDEIKKWYDSPGNECVSEVYTNILLNLIPDLAVEEKIVKTCVTCSSPSLLPYIDTIKQNITVAAVGNGGGVAMSEGVARLALELCVKGIWNSDLPQSAFKAIFCNNRECD